MPKPQTQPVSHQTLGEFDNAFTPRQAPGWAMLGTAIFCAIACIIELITAIIKYNTPPSQILSDKFRQDAILIAGILSIVFLILCLLLLFLYYTHIKHRVDVYKNGLVIQTWQGSAEFPWDEISEMSAEPIYGNSSRVINWNVTLVRGDGKKAKFRGLDGINTLKSHIERKAKYLL